MKRVNVILDTPVGWFEVYGDSSVIHGARWIQEDEAVVGSGVKSVAWHRGLLDQFSRYLEGKLLSFELPFLQNEGAAQWQVWNDLLKNPPQRMLDLDEAMERWEELSHHEVIFALRSNPFQLLIPTHRINIPDVHLSPLEEERVNWMIDAEGLRLSDQLQLFGQ